MKKQFKRIKIVEVIRITKKLPIFHFLQDTITLLDKYRFVLTPMGDSHYRDMLKSIRLKQKTCNVARQQIFICVHTKRFLLKVKLKLNNFQKRVDKLPKLAKILSYRISIVDLIISYKKIRSDNKNSLISFSCHR